LGFIYDRRQKASANCDEAAAQGFSDDAGVKMSKLFYHAYHKLFELTRVLEGGEPAVALAGEERLFVLNLRRQPPQTVDEARARITSIEQKWNQLRDQLRDVRESGSMPNEVEAASLIEWLRSVRTRHCHVESTDQALLPSAPPQLRRQRTCDVEAIQAYIDEIESSENVRIVHAGYGLSSRTLGTTHEGSDHDVKFIFVLQRADYFGLRPPIKTLQRAYPASGGLAEVQMSGWEARHACRLLAESNPTVIDMLSSPIIFKTTPWAEKLMSLACELLNRSKLAKAWARHARGNYETYIARADRPVRKKYVHVLHPLLSLAWLQHKSKQQHQNPSWAWPPACLLELSQQVAADGGLREEELEQIVALVTDSAALPTSLPHDFALDALIEKLLHEEYVIACWKDETVESSDERVSRWHELCVAMVDAMACA